MCEAKLLWQHALWVVLTIWRPSVPDDGPWMLPARHSACRWYVMVLTNANAKSLWKYWRESLTVRSDGATYVNIAIERTAISLYGNVNAKHVIMWSQRTKRFLKIKQCKKSVLQFRSASYSPYANGHWWRQYSIAARRRHIHCYRLPMAGTTPVLKRGDGQPVLYMGAGEMTNGIKITEQTFVVVVVPLWHPIFTPEPMHIETLGCCCYLNWRLNNLPLAFSAL